MSPFRKACGRLRSWMRLGLPVPTHVFEAASRSIAAARPAAGRMHRPEH